MKLAKEKQLWCSLRLSVFCLCRLMITKYLKEHVQGMKCQNLLGKIEK